MDATSPAQIATLLMRFGYTAQSEADVQEGIARVLTAAGIAHQREVRLSEKDRIDFLLESGVGVEVKIQGPLSALTRQAHRYLQHQEIHALVIASTRFSLARLPERMNDKPIVCAVINGGGL